VIVCFVDIGGIVDHHFKLSFRNTSSEEMQRQQELFADHQ
jgi:hypothetical protein